MHANPSDIPSPAERLAQSRQALLQGMRPDKASRRARPSVSDTGAGTTAATAADNTDAAMPTSATSSHGVPPQAGAVPPGSAQQQERTASAEDGDATHWFSTAAVAAQRLLAAWWQRHPLNTVLEVSTPLLQGVARRHPYRILAVAAAAGAAVVVLKPWRWTRTRRWARSQVNREIGGMNLTRLSQMVLDSLLYNGKPPRS